MDPTSERPDTRAVGRSLMDRLARAWNKTDATQLAAVFAADAVFIETPFSDPLKGAEAIQAYWRDVPYHQSDVKFTTGEIYTAGPWFSAEFKLVYQRRRTGEWVEARGAIFCETAGDQITEMRMYWHRWNGGKETSKP